VADEDDDNDDDTEFAAPGKKIKLENAANATGYSALYTHIHCSQCIVACQQ